MRIDGLEVVHEFNPDFASGQFGFPKDLSALTRVAKGGSASP
jgi:taurine dioxygenase